MLLLLWLLDVVPRRATTVELRMIVVRISSGDDGDLAMNILEVCAPARERRRTTLG